VEPAIAHTVAIRYHKGQRNRFGDRVIDHVERVAAAVPPDARATALLHDLLELCPTVDRRLRGKGLTRTELKALQLLTHAPGEPYKAYIRRIADASGPAGRLARTVKLADLEDHLAHPLIPPGTPRRTRGRANDCSPLVTRRRKPRRGQPRQHVDRRCGGIVGRRTLRAREAPTVHSRGTYARRPPTLACAQDSRDGPLPAFSVNDDGSQQLG